MKTECVKVTGVITKVLPNGFFRVTLDKVNCECLAYISGKLSKKKIILSVGDKVSLEMSPTDTTKARIIELIK